MYETHIKKKKVILLPKKIHSGPPQKIIIFESENSSNLNHAAQLKIKKRIRNRKLNLRKQKCMILLLFLMYAGVNIDYIRS